MVTTPPRSRNESPPYAAHPPQPTGLLDLLDESLDYTTYSKRAMIVLSHAIEHPVVTGEVGGILLAGFQRLSLLGPELCRYRLAARAAKDIHVWGVPDVQLPGDLPPNLHVHPLDSDDPLCRTWFVIAYGAQFWAALLSEEIADSNAAARPRLFYGGWTDKRSAVRASIQRVSRLDRSGAQIPSPSQRFPDTEARPNEQAGHIWRITSTLSRHLDKTLREEHAARESALATAAENAALLQKEQAQRQELERLTDLRKLFSDSLVHDLRNPLQVVTGFLELLVQGHAGDLTPRQREFASAALESGHRTTSMVREILDVARLEAGAMPLRAQRLERAALNQLLTEIATTRRELGQDVTIELSDAFSAFDVDPALLIRVIGNLLDNAAKYAPGTPVIVKAELSDNAVIISIADRGPGIPVAEHDAIFEVFHQVESQPVARGVGLGLAFCKLAVQAHGATIALDRSYQDGSRFVLRFPTPPGDANPPDQTRV